MLNQGINTGEAGPLKRFASEDAEPDLHLIEPTGRSRDVVKSHVRMPGQPVIALFMRGQVVHDDVQDLARSRTSRHLVHEGQEILARFGLTRPANDFAARHFKGCKQRGGAVALVSALVALHHLLARRHKSKQLGKSY